MRLMYRRRCRPAQHSTAVFTCVWVQECLLPEVNEPNLEPEPEPPVQFKKTGENTCNLSFYRAAMVSGPDPLNHSG